MMEHVEQDICCPFCDLSGITPNEMNLHINKVHLQEYFNSDEPTENRLVNGDYKKSDRSQSSKDSKSEDSSSGCDKENRNGASWIDPERRTRLSLDVKSLEPVLQMRQNCADNIVKSGVTAACGSAQSGLNLRSGEVSASAPPFIIPDINDNVEPDINCNIPSEFCCPLCHFSTSSEGDIQSHVNREHVDILSPCKPPSGSSDPTDMDSSGSTDRNFLSVEHSRNLQKLSSDNVCPICGMIVNTTQELEIHVNSKHSDILSPDKPYATSMSMSQSMESTDWSDVMACPVCDQEFDDPGLLQLHVNGHFSAEQTPVQEFSDQVIAQELEKSEIEEKAREQKEFHALQAMYGMVGGTNYKKQYEKNLERAVIRGDINLKQFHEKKANLHYRDMIGIDDGHSCCKGLIPKLKDFYKVPIQGLNKYWLCSYIDHFAVSYGDRGWGCGYRNFQMLLSGLTTHPTFCKVVFNDKPQIPSIPKIQRLIEAAWAKGFDKQGCEQLGGKLVDTTKWIGATEIVAVLSSLKVRCQLLDFHNPSGPQGTHPRLFQWIKDYFQQPSPVKLPLYLQHHGHSRTVIGIEELKDGSHRLLIFDPSTSKKQMSQFHGVITANLMRTIRRTIHGLKAKQYQIVAITGILEDREYEEHKILKSERIS
ncbi:hypothetical protein KUTeg_007204 [Tegillarca granosa]|uniref:C2H2-type domain-containing protein n=1 Tax=Tegillarca granosa TaxID=220873 RepID=A0ABQ9FCJ4_TEGGR|nr:hypothetical protein KUTeg_007204 [Tegillarca granosa]